MASHPRSARLLPPHKHEVPAAPAPSRRDTPPGPAPAPPRPVGAPPAGVPPACASRAARPDAISRRPGRPPASVSAGNEPSGVAWARPEPGRPSARRPAGRVPGAPPHPGSCGPKATSPARAGRRPPGLRQPGLIPSARPRCRGGRARPPRPPSGWAPRTGEPGSPAPGAAPGPLQRPGHPKEPPGPPPLTMMATASVHSEGLEDEAEPGLGHRAWSCCWVCSCPLPGRTGQRERQQTRRRESEAGGDAEGRRRTEAWPAGRGEVVPAQGAGGLVGRRLSQWAAALAPPGGGGGGGARGGWEARAARLRRLGVRKGRVRAVIPPPHKRRPR